MASRLVSCDSELATYLEFACLKSERIPAVDDIPKTDNVVEAPYINMKPLAASIAYTIGSITFFFFAIVHRAA